MKWINYHYSDGLFWIRVLKLGLYIKDIRKQSILFSERKGIGVISIGPYIIGKTNHFLTPHAKHVPTPTEWRLVAFIYPESFFKSIDDAWKKDVRIAHNTEKKDKNIRYNILKVGPEAGDVHTRMPYSDNAYLPEGITIEQFKQWAEQINHALNLPPLFREDFTYLGRFGDD